MERHQLTQRRLTFVFACYEQCSKFKWYGFLRNHTQNIKIKTGANKKLATTDIIDLSNNLQIFPSTTLELTGFGKIPKPVTFLGPFDEQKRSYRTIWENVEFLFKKCNVSSQIVGNIFSLDKTH